MCNLVLDSFVPGVMFYETDILRMCWGHIQGPDFRHDFPATLRGDGSWPRYGYKQRPTGGTGYQAIAQLIRYVRDLPRLPMETWEYWGSEKVNLCKPRTLELLKSCDYGDPAKTKCILCGLFPMKSIDWWSLDGVTGPCCYGGRCLPEWFALKGDTNFKRWFKAYRAKQSSRIDLTQTEAQHSTSESP